MCFRPGSANQISIDDCLSELRLRYNDIAKKSSVRRAVIKKLDFEGFKSLLQGFGSLEMIKAENKSLFSFDKYNLPIVEQLYLYTVGDPQFNGSLSKGIAVNGKYGCGKTIIMTAYTEMINFLIGKYELRQPLYRQITASYFVSNYSPALFADYSASPLLIDEFGREAKTAKVYGTEVTPIIDLLFERHRRNAITHITSNFMLETLSGENMYGDMLGDRFNEMFNFITLQGNSRRK